MGIAFAICPLTNRHAVQRSAALVAHPNCHAIEHPYPRETRMPEIAALDTKSYNNIHRHAAATEAFVDESKLINRWASTLKQAVFCAFSALLIPRLP